MPAESTQPDPVGEKDVVERAMNGAEEGAKIAPPVIVRKSCDVIVESRVEPGVVLREPAKLPEVSVHARYSGAA
jgi:hypothetical protein